MPPNSQNYENQPPRPPAAPMAPTYPGNLQQDMNRQHNGMGGERFHTRPEYQSGNRNENIPISDRSPSGYSRSQSSKSFHFDNYRMYEFKRHKMTGRKPDWQIVDRTMIPHTDSELKERIRKPAKDNRGYSSKKDLYSPTMLGCKQKQSLQLLNDLQRMDQGFEWHFELIELHDLVLRSKKWAYSKMIVIVSRHPGKGYILAPGIMWALDEAVVDLALEPPVNRARPSFDSAGGQQNGPHVVQTRHGASLAQSADQLPRPNLYDNHDPRPTPFHNGEEKYGHQESSGALQSGQGQRGKDKGDSRIIPIHPTQERGGQHQPNKDLKHGPAEESKKSKDNRRGEPGLAEESKKSKDKKTGKLAPTLGRPTPKRYGDDSDSSSDTGSASDAQTSNTSDTEISFASSGSDKKYSSQIDLKQKKHSHYVPKASYEHRRKNPTEQLEPSRGRYVKENIGIKAASSSGRYNGPSPPRSPSFPRNRPSPGQADGFKDHLRIYDNSPPPPLYRRDLILERHLATGTDACEVGEFERQQNIRLEMENLKLQRELQDRDLREDILREELRRGEYLREERLREELMRDEYLREERQREEWQREDRRREGILMDRERVRYDDKYRSSRYSPSYL